jgi:hypothetical protein
MDETRALPAPRRDDEGRVFEYGDRTIGTLQMQTFTVDDYGTRANQDPIIAVAKETASGAAGEDTIARIERNLELALGGIQALLRRIDSIDETLAKLINR